MIDSKERLDILLLKKGFFQSRERARENILTGNIYVDGVKVTKCGKKIINTSNIKFVGRKLPYVGRGGLKLEKALKSFNIDLKNKVCMDIGASTGGFTDCMLQNGAVKIYSVDVGNNQLHIKLRNDKRVISFENTNARYLNIKQIGEFCDFISIDVSFISVIKILPNVCSFLNRNGEIVLLIKPQFEAGRSYLNKKGVVRDKNVHINVIKNIIQYVKNTNLKTINLQYSPIMGPNGNIEYLLYMTKNINYNFEFSLDDIEIIVEEAHEKLL